MTNKITTIMTFLNLRLLLAIACGSLFFTGCASNPLVSSITQANDAEAIRLIEQGDIDISSREFWSGLAPLHHAVIGNRVEVVRSLVEHGADINVPTEFRLETPLHLTKNGEIAHLLVSGGADLGATEARGLTPLLSNLNSLSPDNDNFGNVIDIAKIILNAKREIDLQAQDLNGMSALHHAARLDS